MSALTDKAMLVTLNRSVWTARKHDRVISDEVAKQHEAESDAGRYIKRLIPKDAMQDIKTISQTAYAHHRANSLPWDDFATRLLPVGNYFDYTEKQRQFSTDFDKAADEFIGKFATLLKAEEKRQGKMFNASDYPSPAALKSKFGIRVTVMPVPEAADFRVDLSKKEVDKIRREVTDTVTQRLQEASQELWVRLEKHVTHLKERLSKYEAGDSKRLHASLLTNLAEVIDVAGKLNFTDDKNLDKMRETVQTKLLSHDIDALRHSDSLRAEQAKAADSILKAMSAYTGA